MNKIFLVFAFLLPITSYAEWLLVDVNEGAAFFIEDTSVEESDGYVYFWMLTNFHKPVPTTGHLSAKTLEELDCKTPRKSRTLSISAYKEAMAVGNADITRSKAGNWVYFQPNSTIELIAETVCQLIILKN